MSHEPISAAVEVVVFTAMHAYDKKWIENTEEDMDTRQMRFEEATTTVQDIMETPSSSLIIVFLMMEERKKKIHMSENDKHYLYG